MFPWLVNVGACLPAAVRPLLKLTHAKEEAEKWKMRRYESSVTFSYATSRDPSFPPPPRGPLMI